MPQRCFAVTVLCLAATTPPVVGQQPGSELLASDRPIEQAIDHYVDAKFKTANLHPPPLADDAPLLRRLTLDLNGRIPTLAETTDYVSSSDPAKRIKLVDRLLNSSAFSRHQAQEFLAFLQVIEERPRKGQKQTGL